MVKGVSKRVVVVRATDSRFFEEAIFIVKGNVEKSGISADQIVKEACRVADRYLAKNAGKKWPRFRVPKGAFLFLGAGITGLIWLLSTILM